MTFLSGETWDGPVQTNVARYEDTIDQSLDAVAQGHLANRFRDNYFASSTPADLMGAMHNYQVAIEKSTGDPASEAWLRCHRLNLYAGMLEGGSIHVGDFEDEIIDALAAARKTRYWDDPLFKIKTERWLHARLHELYEPAKQVSEEAVAIGGLAVSSSAAEARPEPSLPAFVPA